MPDTNDTTNGATEAEDAVERPAERTWRGSDLRAHLRGGTQAGDRKYLMRHLERTADHPRS